MIELSFNPDGPYTHVASCTPAQVPHRSWCFSRTSVAIMCPAQRATIRLPQWSK